MRSRQVCPGQLHALQVRPGEPGLFEVGFIEIGSAEVGLLQVRAGEVRFSQDRLVKVRSAERHAPKARLGEVRVAEVVAIENDTGVAFGEIIGSEHRMDLWVLASPLVPRGFAAPENPQVFRPLTLAGLELDRTVNVCAR